MKNVKLSSDNVIGVYKIINTVNFKFYIGSSLSIYYRAKMHLSHLRRNVHGNKYLQRSFNKYGEDKFTFEILEKCNKDIVRVREKYYIDSLKPHYNMKDNTNVPIITEELKKRISETLKRKYKSGEISKIWNKDAEVAVKIYDYNGNFIKKFNSISACSKNINIIKETLSSRFNLGIFWHDNLLICKENENIYEVIDNYFNKKITNGTPNFNNLPVLFIRNNKVTIFQNSPFGGSKQKIFKSKNYIYKVKRDCVNVPNAKEGYFTFMGHYARLKSDKLLETPEEDNQQPI